MTRTSLRKTFAGKSSVSAQDYLNSIDQLEHDIQVEFFNLLHFFKFEGIPLKECVYAIPNGGQRGKKVAGEMKAEGVLKGVLDIHCYIPRNGYHSLYIEMKKPKTGRLSPEQKIMIERLRLYGHKVEVHTTANGALDELLNYLGLKK